MIDFEKPVETMDGDKVEILRHDLNNKLPVLGLILHENGIEETCQWDSDGECHYDDGYNLRNVKNVQTVYVNIYEDNDCVAYFHKTRTEADRLGMDGRIACIKIEYKEGQFDD